MSELNCHTSLVSTAARDGQVVRAALTGEIDMHTSPELRVALLQVMLAEPVERLVLDLAAVPYLDSSAIAVLVEALIRLRRTGGTVTLLNPQPKVRGLLEIARLTSLFQVGDGELAAA